MGSPLPQLITYQKYDNANDDFNVHMDEPDTLRKYLSTAKA